MMVVVVVVVVDLDQTNSIMKIDFRNGSHPEELGLSISSPLHPQGADIWLTCRVGRLGPMAERDT
jgi:hypothetical protein